MTESCTVLQKIGLLFLSAKVSELVAGSLEQDKTLVLIYLSIICFCLEMRHFEHYLYCKSGWIDFVAARVLNQKLHKWDGGKGYPSIPNPNAVSLKGKKSSTLPNKWNLEKKEELSYWKRKQA